MYGKFIISENENNKSLNTKEIDKLSRRLQIKSIKNLK